MPEVYWPHFAAGLALCLMGWTLYWVALNLAGAAAGAILGFALSYVGADLARVDPAEVWWIPALGTLAGFILGIFLMRGVHRFVFFLVGAALGLAVGQQGFEWANEGFPDIQAHAAAWRVGFLAGGAVLGGVVMLWGSRWVVALLTSVAGSLLVVLSIADPLALLVLAPLIPASFFFQLGLLRRIMPRPRKHRPDDEDE